MSIEQLIAENTQAQLAVVEALKTNTAHLERVIAGQEQAMAKLEGGKPAATRGRKPATAATEETPVAPTPTPAATAQSFLPKIPTNQDEMKAYVGDWTKSTDDADERGRRVQFLKDMATEFGGAGTAALVSSPENAKRAVFYIERKKSGLDVNFSADYDYDGDPSQGGSAPAAEADGDDFD